MPDFQYPIHFDTLSDPLQKRLVDEMREKLVASIVEQTEAVVSDAIPKALAAKTGLAWKSTLESIDPHPLWEAKSQEVRHVVRFMLMDHCPPPRGDGWSFMSYLQLKSLWDRHLVTIGADLAKKDADG